MRRIISIIMAIAVLSVFMSYADINTDRTMAKILRDTKTYISADARASTEQDAYDEALKKLTGLVTEYLKTIDNNDLPDAVYLPQLSQIYDRLNSQIENNRYRVMLYVKKSDIKPVSNSSGSIVLSKTDENEYSVLPTTPVESIDPVFVTDTVTVVEIIEKPLDPTLSIIASKRTKDDLISAIQTLGKSGNLAGAAKFPIERANDYYVAVIGADNNVSAILHYIDGSWKEISSGKDVNINDYTDCSGYWFTLPLNK